MIASQLVQKGGEVEWPFTAGRRMLLNQGTETELLTVGDHHTSVSYRAKVFPKVCSLFV